MNSRLEQLYQQHRIFSDTTFGKATPYTGPLHHLKEEVEEAIESGAPEEFADMFLLLLDAYGRRFPENTSEDLLDTTFAKLTINKKRKWGEADENGVVRHVD